MSQNVLDNWGELEDLEDSNKPLSSQQQKMIEERKRMEDSDNKLTESLFSVTPPIKQENNNEPICKKGVSLKKPERIKKNFKKDLSIKINNRTTDLNERFGECDDKSYDKYCELEEKYLD